MAEYYRLEGKVAVPVDDVLEWAKAFEGADRRVALDKLSDNVKVSTVFLGSNHNFANIDPPLIFETMIFGGEHDQWQDRCSTWEQAEEMHKRAVALASS